MLRRKAIEASEYKRLNNLIVSSLPNSIKKKSKLTSRSSVDESKTVDDLTDSFIEHYKRFECEGKKEQKNDLVTMLDELKHRKGISRKNYDILKKKINWIYKNPIPTVKCVTNEIVEFDVKELHKILAEIREKVDDERIDQLEKLLGAGDYIDGKPSLPIVLKALDDLDDVIEKSTLYRLKSLINDLDKNKYRVVTIFTRLQNAKDKEDEKNILKQLASEELLSAGQYNQLSQLDEIEPRSIANIIKGTKIGRGLMHMPVGTSDLKDELFEALNAYKNGPSLPRIFKLRNELSRRDGISRAEHETIKKDLNVL